MIRKRLRFDQEAPVAFVRIAPSHDRVVSASAVDSRASLWGWGEGEVARWALPHRKGVATSAVFHPDGTIFAATGPARPIDIHRTEDGALASTFGSVPESIWLYYERVRREPEGTSTAEPYFYDAVPPATGYLGVTFSPSGGLILARPNGSIRTEVIESGTGTLVETIFDTDLCYALHPEREIVAATQHHDIGNTIWFLRFTDTVTCYKRTLEPALFVTQGLAFSVGGDGLAVIGATSHLRHDWGLRAIVYDFPSLEERFRVDLDLPESWPSYINIPMRIPVGGIAFSPDGRRLLVPTPTGFLAEHDATTGQEMRRWKAHDGPVTCLDVRAKDRLLVTGGSDGAVTLWELDDTTVVPPPLGRTLTERFLAMTTPGHPRAPWSDRGPSEPWPHP